MLLGVQDGLPLVLYAGQLQGTSRELSEVVCALNALVEEGVRVALAPRQHPRTRNDAPEELEPWDQALASFQGAQLFSDTSAVATPEMVAAADVVVAAFSTVLIEAACLRKQVIAINDEAAMARFRESAGGVMDEFPLVELGCARKVTSAEDLHEALRAALTSGLDLREAQERHFALDGCNAQRAAERVLALLG